MASDVTVLYTDTEKRLRPLYERLIDVINEHPEDLTVAEIVGTLEIIKVEVMENLIGGG